MLCHAHRAALVALVALVVSTPVFASSVSGQITLAGCTLEPSHVAAFTADLGPMLVFTDRPLDIDLAYAFDPRQSALEDLTLDEPRADKGLIVTFMNGILNHFFFCTDPETKATTQTSGHQADADLTVNEESATRHAARWALAKGTDLYGKAMSWDLEWAADIADPAVSGEPLPRKGGKPGKVYSAYLADLAAGNIDDLRRFMNNPYYLAEDATPEEIASDLEGMRASQPVEATITGGLIDATAAILEIDATMTDGSTPKQRVLLKLLDGRWTFGGFQNAE